MKKIKNAVITAVFWLALWEIASAAVGKELLLPSPFAVAAKLFELCQTEKFWVSAAVSLIRVSAGFVLGTVLGILFAVLTYKYAAARAVLAPALHAIKATPVASFIILALVWLSVSEVPALTSALVVLPAVWAGTERGLLSVDPLLSEMAAAFRLNKTEKLKRLILPSVKPFFLAAAESSLGMAWKAGIAAEVICPYKNSIGSALYDSKIYLETTELFAWTAAVIVLSVLLEKLVVHFIQRGGSRRG